MRTITTVTALIWRYDLHTKLTGLLGHICHTLSLVSLPSWLIQGFKCVTSLTIPSIDEGCG